MTLTAGQQLATYEILGPLGAGGMGEVYRARDTRLDREVALKVLPQELAGDSERMARFEREAKVLASLQHPNIVTVHSIEESGGLHFLTMELVEGSTLVEAIQPGGMSLSAFYPIAIAIADALSTAHLKGITHRDLKPANVIVDAAGRAKVLDFGLAKVEGAEAGGRRAASTLTGDGRAMGTIPYMAPEALRGAQVDSRTDLFSLGVVLYELVTGAHPFPAQDPGERISAIMRDTPAAADELRGDVPAALSRTLASCLEKDPERRQQTALGLRDELEELASAGAGVSNGYASAPRRRTGLLLFVGLVAVAACALGLASLLRSDGPLVHYDPMPLTSTSGFVTDPSWSPGGEFISFSRMERGSLDLYVKAVGGGEATPRVIGPGDEAGSRWCPDGKTISYISTEEPGTWVYLIGAHGGEPTKLIETNIPALHIDTIHMAMGGRPWSSDGRHLLVSRVTPSGQLAIFRVDRTDGSAAQLTHPSAGSDDFSGSLSFDGERIAFARMSSERGVLWIMPADDPQAAEVFFEDEFSSTQPTWRPDGERIIFESSRWGGYSNLWEIDVESRDLRQLTSQTKMLFGFSVSNDDRVAYTPFWHDTFLTVLDLETGKNEGLTRHKADNFGARFSPDGSKVAYHSTRTGNSEIWVRDLSDGSERQLTFDPGFDVNADWAPDGERLIFVSNRGGAPMVFVMDADGGNPVRLVDQAVTAGDPGAVVAEGLSVRWSPDGERIGYIVSAVEGQVLWSVRPDGSDARPIVEGVKGFDWYLDGQRVICTRSRGNADELFAVHAETGQVAELWQGVHSELDVAPDGESVMFCFGYGHLSMGLSRIRLTPPSGSEGLPTRNGEVEHLLRPDATWHVHQGGWSPDSKRIVYTFDEDYSDIYELVKRQ